jgi:hypothetical protein
MLTLRKFPGKAKNKNRPYQMGFYGARCIVLSS